MLFCVVMMAGLAGGPDEIKAIPADRRIEYYNRLADRLSGDRVFWPPPIVPMFEE